MRAYSSPSLCYCLSLSLAVSCLLSSGIYLSCWSWKSLITALCLLLSAPVAQCPKMYINAWSCLKIPPRGHQCTKSITSDKLDVIWPWYGRTAGYWVRARPGGMWVFNHAQICPSGCTYNSRRLDMSIVGLMETWISWAGSRAIFGNVHIWALFRICLPHPRPMSTYVHRSSRLCINAHLRTLAFGSPSYRFISGYPL